VAQAHPLASCPLCEDLKHGGQTHKMCSATKLVKTFWQHKRGNTHLFCVCNCEAVSTSQLNKLISTHVVCHIDTIFKMSIKCKN